MTPHLHPTGCQGGPIILMMLLTRPIVVTDWSAPRNAVGTFHSGNSCDSRTTMKIGTCDRLQSAPAARGHLI